MRRTRPHLQELSSPSTASPQRTRQRTTSTPSLESPDEQLIIESGEHLQPYSPSDTIESLALSTGMSTPVEFIATEESLPVPDVVKVIETPPEAVGNSNQPSAAPKEKHIAGGELSPVCISSDSTNDSDCVVVEEPTQPKKEEPQRKRRASPYHYHFWRPRSPLKSFKKKKMSASRERAQSASGSREYAKHSVEGWSTQDVIPEAKKPGNYPETSARKKNTNQPKKPNTDSNIATSGDNKPSVSTKQTKEGILETKSVKKESNSPQKSKTDETKFKASMKKRKKAKSKKRHATKSKDSTEQASVQISEEHRVERDSNPAQKSSVSTDIRTKVTKRDGKKSKLSAIPTKVKSLHEHEKAPQESLITTETKQSKTSIVTKGKKDGSQDTLVSTETHETKCKTQTERSVAKTDSKLSERTAHKSTESKTSSVSKDVSKARSDSKSPSKSAEFKETQLVAVVTKRADIDDSLPNTSLPKAKETKTAQKMSFVDIVKALLPRIKSRRQALTISQEVAARINRQPLYQPQSLTSRLLRSAGVQTAMNWYHIIPLHRDAASCSLRELIRIAVQYEKQVLGKTGTHNLPIHIAKCPQRPLCTIRPDISAATTSRSVETDVRWFELVQVLDSPGQRFYCRAILPRRNTSSGQTAQHTAGNSQTTGVSKTTRQTVLTTAQAPQTTQSRVEMTSTATQSDLQTTPSNVAVGTHDADIPIKTDVAVGTDDSENQIPESSKLTAATQTQPISTKTQSTLCDVPEQVNAATQYDPPPLVRDPVVIETDGGEVNTLAILCQLTMLAPLATHTSVQTTGFEVDTLFSLCRVAMSEPVSKQAATQTIGIEVKIQATLTDATELPKNEQYSQWEPQRQVEEQPLDYLNTAETSNNTQAVSNRLPVEVEVNIDRILGELSLESNSDLDENVKQSIMVSDVVDISNTHTNSKRETLSDILPDGVTTLSSDSSEGPWDVRNLRENINEIDKECKFTFANVDLHSDACLDMRPSTSEPALHRLNVLKKDHVWQFKPNFSARRNSGSSSETVELAIWQEIECMRKAKSANVISDTQTTQTASRQQISTTKDERCTQNTEHDEKNSRNENIDVQNQPPNFNGLALQRSVPPTPIQRIPCVSLDRLVSTNSRDMKRQITRRYSDPECGVGTMHDTAERQNSILLAHKYVTTQLDGIPSMQEIRARREVINNLYTQFGNLNSNIVWIGRLRRPVDIRITIRHILGITKNITSFVGDCLNISKFCSLQVLQDSIANLVPDGEMVLSIGCFLPQNAKFTEGYEIVFNELKVTLKESKVPRIKKEDIEMYLYPLQSGATFDCGTQSEEWIGFLNNEHRPNLLLAFMIHSKRMCSPFSYLFDKAFERAMKASQIIIDAEVANQSNTEESENNGSEVQNQMKSEQNIPDTPSRQPSTESSGSKATEVQNEPRSAVTVPDTPSKQPSTESSGSKATEVPNEPRSSVAVPDTAFRRPSTESSASNNTEVTNQSRTKETLTATIGKRTSFESAYDGDISQSLDGLSHTEVTPVKSAPEHKRVTEEHADTDYEDTPKNRKKASRMKRRSKLPNKSTSSPPTTESTDKSIKDEDGLQSKGSAKRKQSLKKRKKREVSLLTPPSSSSFYRSERLTMRRPENSGNENNVISVPAVSLSQITNREIISHPFQETLNISKGSVSESQNQAFPRMRSLTSSSSIDEETSKQEAEQIAKRKDRYARKECQHETTVKQGRTVESETDPNIKTDIYNIKDVDLSYTSSTSDGNTKKKYKLKQDRKKRTLQKRSSDYVSLASEYESKCKESPRQTNSTDSSLEIIDLTGIDSSSSDDETDSENEEIKTSSSERKLRPSSAHSVIARNEFDTHTPTVETSLDMASKHCSPDLGSESRKGSEGGVTTHKEHTRETSLQNTESEKHEARDKENQSLRFNISGENNPEDRINTETFGSTYNSSIMQPVRSDSGAFDLHYSDSESDETSSDSNSSVKTTISKAASIKVAEETTKDNETDKKDDNQAINDSDRRHSTESGEKARSSKTSNEDTSSGTESSGSSTTTSSGSKNENSSHSSSSDDDTLKDEIQTTIPQNKTNESGMQDMAENTDAENTEGEEDMLQTESFDQNTNLEIVEAFNNSPHIRRIAEGVVGSLNNAEESLSVEKRQHISTEQHQAIAMPTTSSVQPSPNRAPKDPIFRKPAKPINPPESENLKSNESAYWPFPLSERETRRGWATEAAQAESGEVRSQQVSCTCLDSSIIESTLAAPQGPSRVIRETPEAAIEEAAIGGTFDIPTSPTSSGPACVENSSVHLNEEDWSISNLLENSTDNWEDWAVQARNELIDVYSSDVLLLEESSNTQVKESSKDDIVPK